jgi:mono/diheme cytochrome c family protein
VTAGAADLTNTLVALLQSAQLALLRVWHALGLAGDIGGQPAWPFAKRLALETLVIDAALARQLAWALGAAVLIAALLLCGVFWRRGRWPAWGLALVAAAAVPWPAASLLTTDAVPTSFQRSPTAFDAEAIAHGLALYQTHCAACHGSDGRGETPQAAALPTWPPRLTGALLWKRAEGELHWRIRQGMRDRHDALTMPGFATVLSDADTWAVLDALRALAAGDSVRRDGVWQWPVRAPGLRVRCDGAAARTLAEWRGQRVRIVVARDVSEAPREVSRDDPRANAEEEPREDPRFVTVVLRAASSRSTSGCTAASPATLQAALQAYASVAGVARDALPGTQFIVDREGWLRALAPPGNTAWSADRLLCRSTDAATSADASNEDGLDAMIRQMDADPVRIAAFGLAHGR